MRWLVAILLIWASPMSAQTDQRNLAATRFLVIDQDELFANSQFGQRVIASVDARTEALVTENRQIETALTEEERELTEQRATLEPAEFRELADDFDERVQQIRNEQDAKQQAIGAVLDDGRREFFQAIIPILTDLMREEGVLAILDKRVVLISANIIDVTDRAIARIDAQLGVGASPEAEAPIPEQ